MFGALFALAGVNASAQTATPAAGVPLDLAARRAAIVNDLRYELALSVPDRASEPVSALSKYASSWRTCKKNHNFERRP